MPYRGDKHFLSRAVWDDQRVLAIASAWAVSDLDDGDAVLIGMNSDEKSRPTLPARPASTAAPWAVSRCARWRSP